MVSVNLNNRNWKHILWLPGICIFVFGLPFIFMNLLDLDIDLFYSLFSLAGLGFLWFYTKKTSLKLKPALNSGWALGVVMATFIGLALLSYTISVKSNPAQSNLYSNILTIIWRGIIFGTIGTALVTVFPFITVWRSFAGIDPTNLRKAGVIMVAAAAILLVSLSYNLGRSGFDRDQIEYNVKMTILSGLPTLISGNPLASPIAGAFLYSGESMFSDDKLAARQSEGSN